jgi:hypothetical protein
MLVSKEVKDHTQRAVREHLPALISACYYDPYEAENDMLPIKYKPFRWLRRVAGDSWHSFEAGCAMLEKVLDEETKEAAAFLVAIGTALCGRGHSAAVWQQCCIRRPAADVWAADVPCVVAADPLPCPLPAYVGLQLLPHCCTCRPAVDA